MASTELFADSDFFIADITVEAFGTPVVVRVGGSGAEELAAEVLTTWAWCGAARQNVDKTSKAIVVLAVLDPDEGVHEQIWELRGVAGETLEIVSEALAPAITLRAIEAGRGELLMLHAAGLCDPTTGRTAVLVGASGTGKSTACRVLGHEFGYVSDETIALTADLDVRTYPKPLSLLPEGRTWGKHQHGPDDLGLTPAPSDLSVGAIVILTREAEAPQPAEVTDLNVAEAVALVAEQSSYIADLERPLHRVAAVVNAAAGAVRVRYRDAADLAPALRDLLTREPSPGPGPDEPQPTIADLGSEEQGWGLTVQRRPLLDLYVEGGWGAALRSDGGVMALSPLATRVLTLLADGTSTVPELTAVLVDEYGAPPDEPEPIRIIDDIVAALVGDRLLEHLDAPDTTPPSPGRTDH